MPLKVEGKLSENKVDLTTDKIIFLALQRNAEMVEASPVAEVVELEVNARSLVPSEIQHVRRGGPYSRLARSPGCDQRRVSAWRSQPFQMLTELAGSRVFRVETGSRLQFSRERGA
jgi:hypothetical protein